ncbi:MAG: PIN domain-containing protein [Candidatus Micrarchaeota archaeon]
MQENRLLDSNILVYAFDTSEGDKHKKAKILLNDCIEGKQSFSVSFQNISEFYNIVTTKIQKPLPLEEASRICEKIFVLNSFRKIIPTSKSLLLAMTINKEYGIHYWDALIAADMIENGVHEIYTENLADFKKVPLIKATNPFE